jgi:hypothetical protein
MSRKDTLNAKITGVRCSSRVHCLREITVTYEGQNEHTVVRAPDLSASGMFINTMRAFPEGAVLNLRFRLAITNAIVETRSEVRYCLPGVGVGVEFVGLAPDARKAIERELALNGETRRRVKNRAGQSRTNGHK